MNSMLMVLSKVILKKLIFTEHLDIIQNQPNCSMLREITIMEEVLKKYEKNNGFTKGNEIL
jgi:hypothetical protein